ncbi:MAG: hypothetical protein ABI691_09935 [Ginsengibacter sp.]
MEMYDNENTVQKSFDIDFLPEELLQAQWAKFIEFKKIITEVYNRNRPPKVFGACYINKERMRLKQESFYSKMGMAIITDKADSFTATKERFWPQRFTQEKLYDYLPFVSKENISFILPDSYRFAMQVRIKKKY